MKRKLQILAFAAIAVATLASCAKEQLRENVIPAGEKIQVSISGQIGDFTPADATKANAESVVRVTWAKNDEVYVYDGTDASIGTLTVTPDENNASYALLSGEITASTAETAPTKLTLVYVKGATAAPAIAGGKISVDLSTQNQSEVPFVLYSTIDYNASKLQKNSEYVPFSFATSVMTVNCTTLPVGEANAKIGITKAEIEGVSTICELTVTGTGVSIAGANKGTITRTETSEPSVFTQSDSRGSFRLALAADPETPAARNILVFQETIISGSPFTTTKLEENCSYNTVYQMVEYVAPPAGILQGEFTVDSNEKKVRFSQGNLQATYNGSSYTWGFAANQYDYVGNAAGNTSIDSQTSGAVVDLFGWVGASSSFTGDAQYGVSTSKTASDYGNVASEALKSDWGNTIDNSGTWRTLTLEEWCYLFAYDPDNDDFIEDHPRRQLFKYGVTVCGKKNCVVLLPDDWNTSVISLENFASTSNYSEETSPKWSAMEAAGAVCLPAAGNRNGSDVFNAGGTYDYYGNYWSSTAEESNYAFSVLCQDNGVCPDYDSRSRNFGFSVRLITESAGGNAPAVKVTGVSLNKSKTSIEAGATETLSATVTPANAANKQVNWTSSDTTVATVDENGEVTGVAEGSAVITATTADGNFTAVCLVTVAPGVPAGALKGKFSVSNDSGTTINQVYFSQGNLYYDGSNFNFEANQYDFRTYAGKNSCINGASSTTGTPTGHWGLFGWSTASTNYGIKTSNTASDYPGDFVDWGKNMGDGNTWRTLSRDEWLYLFNTRTASTVNGTANARYAKATVNDIKGIILLPDTYTHPEGVTDLTSINTANATFTANTYNLTNWEKMEAAGAVFLPAAGYRTGSDVYHVGVSGSYWSSTSYYPNTAPYVFFNSSNVNPSEGGDRSYGYGVRLITECQ